MLKSLQQAVGLRLVIVTGRWIKDLIPLLQIEEPVEIWGSHGLERLKADSSYEVGQMSEEAVEKLVAADEWIGALGLADRSEKKPGSLALHWRGLSTKDIDRIRTTVEPEWLKLIQVGGLEMKEFDGGIELRAEGRDKGDAVRTILREAEDNALAAYLGDDATDEDAFRAIKGRGIGVLVREALRPTAADLWLRPPEELLQFLELWLRPPKAGERA
jgi:trehalose-phosphatase